MKYRAFSQALVLSLLISGIAGSGGCGHPNPLSAIIISPLVPVVAKGRTHQLFATAVFSNRLSVPGWSQVTWSSSDPSVATVSSTGLVAGVATGTAEITATDSFHPGIMHSVTVYVTDLLTLTVTPMVASVSTGTTQQFTATGIYSADTPTGWAASWPPDITTLVSWSSSSTAVAVVSNVGGFAGLVTAVSAGDTAITATDLATGVTGTANLTVVP